MISFIITYKNYVLILKYFRYDKLFGGIHNFKNYF